MGTDKPWKVHERSVASYFGGKRIVPSDDRSTGDILHEFVYAECKCFKTMPGEKLIEKTIGRAKSEEKVPVVCYKKHGSSDFYIVCRSNDLEALYLAMRERVTKEKMERLDDERRSESSKGCDGEGEDGVDDDTV